MQAIVSQAASRGALVSMVLRSRDAGVAIACGSLRAGTELFYGDRPMN